jgi:choline transport protein
MLTLGDRYHWVSEFAPERYQRFLSYSAGWMSTLGWLASTASSCFVCATLIQAMVEVYNVDFVFVNWKYTLIGIAVMVITIFFNTWGAPVLPMIETISLVGHLLGFLVVIIPVWVMAPKNSASDVFLHFEDNGGWGNLGAACCVSTVSVLYCNLVRTRSGMRLLTDEVVRAAIVSSTSARKFRTHLSSCHA